MPEACEEESRFIPRLVGGRPVFGCRLPGLREFLEAEIRCDGGPFTFGCRGALRAVAENLDTILRLGLPERTVSVLKGAQIGMTTLAVGLALYCVAVRRLNVGYFLPDNDFAARFDDTRVRPVIRSARLRNAMRDGNFRGAAPKGLKEFPGTEGSRFLYIVGLRDVGNAISMPLDVLIRDEVDDIPHENLKWSNDRLDASRLSLTVNLGVGRKPGAGIHAMYAAGDRRTWRVSCLGCGTEATLEESWPGILQETGEEGLALACVRCGARLGRAAGRWFAENPVARRAGRMSFRISQLAVPAVRLERIAAKWFVAQTPSERARFRCASLALPDAGEVQPIDAALIKRLREADPYVMEEVPA